MAKTRAGKRPAGATTNYGGSVRKTGSTGKVFLGAKTGVAPFTGTVGMGVGPGRAPSDELVKRK